MCHGDSLENAPRNPLSSFAVPGVGRFFGRFCGPAAHGYSVEKRARNPLFSFAASVHFGDEAVAVEGLFYVGDDVLDGFDSY